MLARLAASIFCLINVTVCTMVLWSADLYPPTEQSPLSDSLVELLRWGAMLFALPVWFWLGQGLLEKVWNDLSSSFRDSDRESSSGQFSTEILFLAGVATSYLISIYAVLTGSGPLYFEVACALLVFFTLGRWFEARCKLEAHTVLDRMQKLIPEKVRLLHHDREIEIPSKDLVPGDRIRVLAGERIPTDGILLSPRVTLDEQVLTGESVPVERVQGEKIPGGVIDLDGDIVLQVEARVQDGTIARLTDVVRKARENRGQTERLAEKITTWFTPVTLTISLVTLLVHGFLGYWNNGIMAAVSVSLIACPCALGLATSLSIWAAVGRAAEYQVLFRSGEALERLSQTTHLAFDKTGTLTTGQPILKEVHIRGNNEHRQLLPSDETKREVILRLAVTLAQTSLHPYSKALVDSLANHVSRGIVLSQSGTVPGCGIETKWLEGEFTRVVKLGSPSWISKTLLSSPESETGQVWLSVDRQLVCQFAFQEEIRAEAFSACDRLKSLGIELMILTGDRGPTADKIQKLLQIPVQSGLLPEEKLGWIKKLSEGSEGLKKSGRRVVAVGDGINDAPALSAADVGIALASGTDVARAASDLCLLNNQLNRVPWAIELARETMSTIHRNLFWSFAYNSLGVAIAAVGWLNPVIAAVLMTGSSLAVIGNSLRLGQFPIPRETNSEVSEPDQPLPDQVAPVIQTPRKLD